MNAGCFELRLTVLNEIIASGQLGPVALDKVYYPANPDEPIQAVLQNVKSRRVIVLDVNADNSITRGRDRFPSAPNGETSTL